MSIGVLNNNIILFNSLVRTIWVILVSEESPMLEVLADSEDLGSWTIHKEP